MDLITADPGEYFLKLIITDSDGKITTCSRPLIVRPEEETLTDFELGPITEDKLDGSKSDIDPDNILDETDGG